MPMYIAELYDKDNDIYTPIAVSSDRDALAMRCRIVETLVAKDMIVNNIVKGDEMTKEPYDRVQIRAMGPGERLNTYNLFMC